MPRSKPIKIGEIEFPSKKAAEDHIRQIVKRHENWEVIVGLDDQFLRNLILLHPETDQKIGVGIHYFSIRNNPEYRKNREFVFYRIDGSFTEFSWPECLTTSSHETKVRRALRVLVKEQVLSFKIKNFRDAEKLVCPITRIVLNESNSHVDHEEPLSFINLVGAWLRAKGFAFTDILLVPNKDNQFICEMQSQELGFDWTQFHLANAKLRLLSEGANLAKPKSN